VRKCVENIAGETTRRDIIVDVELPSSLPRVQADDALLGQVLNSLLANAVEAMPQAGRLRVRAESDSRARQVLLTVADTGVGIPAHQLAKVFVPFHTTKPRGLGVGLSLAKRIVKRFGGDIAIDSREGHGTTVSLNLLTAR
jgi:two-component system sensor histidine kinase HydH